jgi:tetratricopeptide (TPR) repeat protein
MANVFLSYHREDEPWASIIAGLFERAGHSVWWDRHIKGGHEFDAEIEAALEAADKIVVLWSGKAIKSAWVRDEAGVGRDTGRLVPATIDGTLPPLGFRQFQTIDLSKSKRRENSPEFKVLLAAVDPARMPARETATRNRSFSHPKRSLGIGAAAFLFVLTAIGGFSAWFWRSDGGSAEPRIAIIPADSSPLSQQASRDLVLRIPDLPGMDASTYQLADTPQASSGTDAVLAISAASTGGRERRDLVLRARNQAILWSASVDEPSASSGTLPQQLAIRAQRALSCAADALSYRREAIDHDTFRLYLSACASFDNPYTQSEDAQQIDLLQQVIANVPHFTAAWAKLLLLDLHDIDNGRDRHGRVLATRAHVLQARKLGLDFGELYAAGGAFISPTDFAGKFRNFDDGMRRYPRNAALYRLRAERSWNVGRMSDAVDMSSAAVQFEPLSSENQLILILAYAYGGQTEQAFAQLAKAEKLFPGARMISNARYAIDVRYGDPKEALALSQSSVELGGLQPQQAAFLRARIDPTPANVERAIAQDRIIWEQDPNFVAQIVQTLAQFGHKDEVIDILLHYPGGPVAGLESQVFFRPALREVWRDPRSIRAAAHLGLLSYWKTSGNWPDFCRDPALPYDCKKEAAKFSG